MPHQFKVVPTADHPARSIQTEVDRARVRGDYQCVVALPGKPTHGHLLLAYAEACRSMAELAEKWASEEGAMTEETASTGSDADYRVSFQLWLQPESGVDHATVDTFAPTFRFL